MKVNIQSKHPQFDYKYNCKNIGIVGVYGISGSGKSSLLQAIAGYNDEVQGCIKFRKKTLFDTNNRHFPKVIKCSYMKQHPLLFAHWSIAENLQFAQNYSNNKQKIDELLYKLDCHQLLNKRPKQLSGGEKQRVAFIRALLQIEQGSLVLLDEPYSALDGKLRKIALQLLKNYKDNCLIYLVTHDISELYHIADELLYIDSGHIAYQDPIQKAMASGYKNLPIASKINIENKKHVIYADDVSISLSKNPQSSIIHQIAVTITEINAIEKNIILKLKLNSNIDEKSQQYLYARITNNSLDKLKLKIQQNVFAHFKASSYQD